MENGQATHESRGPSRRDLIKGAAVAGVAAWTAPVIIDSLGSPAAAESLPPCVPQFTAGSAEWVVDNVPYPGCSTYDYHRDLQLKFTVGTCIDAVVVTVTPVVNKAKWCWTGGTPNATITHNFAANAATTTWITPVTGSTEGGCTHTAYPSADDGIHVNLCQTQQVQYTYKIGAQATVTKYVTVAPNGTVSVS